MQDVVLRLRPFTVFWGTYKQFYAYISKKTKPSSTDCRIDRQFPSKSPLSVTSESRAPVPCIRHCFWFGDFLPATAFDKSQRCPDVKVTPNAALYTRRAIKNDESREGRVSGRLCIIHTTLFNSTRPPFRLLVLWRRRLPVYDLLISVGNYS